MNRKLWPRVDTIQMDTTPSTRSSSITIVPNNNNNIVVFINDFLLKESVCRAVHSIEYTVTVCSAFHGVLKNDEVHVLVFNNVLLVI
jgi:hypothetical protein